MKEFIKGLFKSNKFDMKGNVIEECSQSLNFDFTSKGNLKLRKGWRTFEQMVEVLLEMNNRWKKQGFKGSVQFQLPLNHSTVKKLKIIHKK